MKDRYPELKDETSILTSSSVHNLQVQLPPVQPAYAITSHINLSDVFVLLVEDNKINQLVTKIEIKKWHGHIDIASNAHTALDYLQYKKYNVILMDIGLPGINGLQATQYIRNNLPDAVKNVPIIAITASGLATDKQRCIDAGMNDFIVKPYKPQVLYSKLVKWATGIETDSADSTALTMLPDSMPGEALLDLAYLSDLMNGDAVGIEKFLRNYIEDIEEATAVMRKNLKPVNCKALIEIAHKTKTSVTLVGAHKAKEQLYQVEVHCSKKTQAHKITGVVEECIAICLSTVMEARTILQKMIAM